MTRLAYFDCFSGASGDMLLGALLDAGRDDLDLSVLLSGLAIGDWTCTVEKIARHGIGASRVHITAPPDRGHGRRLADIETIITNSRLPESVVDRSVAVFRRLAAAEAHVHQTDVQSIHFHEVGAVDAIIDIVGVCALLDALHIDAVYASALPAGHGFVECMHGTIPIPAPAVLELTSGIPTYGVDVEAELVTPTGAALLVELAQGFGSMPAMRPASAGYGAGIRELPDRPNLLRVIIGERAEVPEATEVLRVETTIDDLSPQFYEIAMERLFAAGALDVTLQPVHGKKNRPAVLCTVLCERPGFDAIADVLFSETTTLGIRYAPMQRVCLERRSVSVRTAYGQVRVKVGMWNDQEKPMPEYEDVRALAQSSGVPARVIAQAALRAYNERERS